MPAPKQRKMAIVGSRAVGECSVLLFHQLPSLRASEACEKYQTDRRRRQVESDGAIRRRPLCRQLLSDYREHFQQDDSVEESGLCDGDYRYGGPGTLRFSLLPAIASRSPRPTTLRPHLVTGALACSDVGAERNNANRTSRRRMSIASSTRSTSLASMAT
jgi:hypothetical protein